MSATSEKVFAVLADSECRELDEFSPVASTSDENNVEADARDRGFVYGLAYAIARAEDPFEDREEFLRRVRDAAEEACLRWDHDLLKQGGVRPSV